jgi:hypothetical protein
LRKEASATPSGCARVPSRVSDDSHAAQLLQPLGILRLPEASAAQQRGNPQSFQNDPRHTARTNTNTSAATTIQINACCGSGGGRRGASLMALPEASWLRCSNLKSRNEAQGAKGAQAQHDGCWNLPSALLRPSREQPFDAMQYVLVVVWPLQRRADLA